MKICPKCKRKFRRLLAVSRIDNETMICDECGTKEALDSLPEGTLEPEERKKIEIVSEQVNRGMEEYLEYLKRYTRVLDITMREAHQHYICREVARSYGVTEKGLILLDELLNETTTAMRKEA